MNEQKIKDIENRIKLLKTRKNSNENIIKKLQRKLRSLQEEK